MKKVIITSPFYTVNDRPASHKSAQAHIYAAMLSEHADYQVDLNVNGKIQDFSPYDEMWVYHGNDFFGSLNLFGGVSGYGGVEELVKFSQFKGKVVSLHIPWPDYGTMIKGRLKGDYPAIWDKVDLGNLERMYLECQGEVKFPNEGVAKNMVIGDSHSICMYRPGWMVNSVPFKTLNGALNDGLQTFLANRSPKKLELYFGNIDIRHHVCRLGDYREIVPELVKRYVEEAGKLPVDHIGIYEPLPIENESRVLPKTGYYKNKPFWGSWEDRNNARELFISELHKNVIDTRMKVIMWTDYLKNPKGELDFKHMEKPRSVHLSRASYPHWTGEKKDIDLDTFAI